MTFSPQTLRDLATFWVAQKGVNLGIVGDGSHQRKGTSYHLGKSALLPGAYSAQTPRDRAGLSEAASAIDLGRLNGSLPELRRFSDWLARRCVKNVKGTEDIREVIYSVDGVTVLGFKDGIDFLIPGYGDRSHLTHTHISYYRDSEKRDKRPAFLPYFLEPPDTGTPDPSPGDDVSTLVTPINAPTGTVSGRKPKTTIWRYDTHESQSVALQDHPADVQTYALDSPDGSAPKGAPWRRLAARPYSDWYVADADVTFTGPAPADCSGEVAGAREKDRVAMLAAVEKVYP